MRRSGIRRSLWTVVCVPLHENICSTTMSKTSGDVLPAYTDIFNGSNSDSAMAETLSAHRRFDISFDRGDKQIALLTLLADKSFSTDHVPTIVEGQSLEAILALHLDSPEPISVIDILVEGKYILGGITGLEETTVFLDHKTTIWSHADGEPSPSTTNSTIKSPYTHFTETLNGEYTWPVSIHLPEKVKLKIHHEAEPRLYDLPQTFNEPFIRATVVYTLSAKLNRHGFLKDDYVMSLPFAYLRVTRPPPIPILRQVAYQEATPILEPTDDPDGWHAEGCIQIVGKLFKTVDFIAQCTLYLAKPLSYTADTFIPLSIKIESNNVQALALLATPQAIHVRVRRQIVDHSKKHSIMDDGSFREDFDYSQRAVWWISETTLPNQAGFNGRVLNGELHLKPGMKPNMELGNFKLNYSVMLYDFSAVGIDMSSKQKFLQEIPIEICTFHASGPRPRPVTTPNCDPDVPYGQLIVPYMDSYSKGFY